MIFAAHAKEGGVFLKEAKVEEPFVVGDSQEEVEKSTLKGNPSKGKKKKKLDWRYRPKKRAYFSFKPGYFFLQDSDMKKFFGSGGFTFRTELGYQFWGPFIVWLDGGYYQETGEALGGSQELKIKLGTATLGLKVIHYFTKRLAAYVGAGPRLFLLLLHNDSPFVRGDDNQIGIGAGFDWGVWFFPIKSWKNVYLELFGDYSWKKMRVDEDEISSIDYDVDISGFSVGAGIGIRF